MKFTAPSCYAASERIKGKVQLLTIQIKMVSSIGKDMKFYTRLNLTLYH